jgi:hypothetical protein
MNTSNVWMGLANAIGLSTGGYVDNTCCFNYVEGRIPQAVKKTTVRFFGDGIDGIISRAISFPLLDCDVLPEDSKDTYLKPEDRTTVYSVTYFNNGEKFHTSKIVQGLKPDLRWEDIFQSYKDCFLEDNS